MVKVSFNQLTTSDVFKTIREFGLENADVIIDDLAKYFEKHGLVLASGSDSVKKIIKRYVKDSKVYSLLIEKIKSLFTQNDEFEIEFCNIYDLENEENDINKESCFRASRKFSINNLKDIGGKLVRVYKNKKYVARFIMIKDDNNLITVGNLYYRDINVGDDFHKLITEKLFNVKLVHYACGRGDFCGFLPFYNNGDWYSNKVYLTTGIILKDKYIHCNNCNKLVKLEDIATIDDDDGDILWICYKCYNDDSIKECPVCGERCYTEDLIWNEYYNDYVCSHCDDKIVRCPSCSQLVHQDELKWNDYYNDFVCYDCRSQIVKCYECDKIVHENNTITINGKPFCKDHLIRCKCEYDFAMFTIEYKDKMYCDDCIEYFANNYNEHGKIYNEVVFILYEAIKNRQYNKQMRNKIINFISKKIGDTEKRLTRKILADLIRMLKYGKFTVAGEYIIDTFRERAEIFWNGICEVCGNWLKSETIIFKNEVYCEECFNDKLNELGLKLPRYYNWTYIYIAVKDGINVDYHPDLINFLRKHIYEFTVIKDK